MSRYLTTKLPSYLLRLNLIYDRSAKHLERDLITACRYVVDEDVSHDNWNGGTYGHNVTFFLPLSELSRIDIADLSSVGEGICQDLNTLAQAVETEFFHKVHLELEDDNDLQYQRAIPFSSKPPVNPDSLSIWKSGLGRVFISHRDKHKVEARELADALEEYGMSSFVAHETIPANEEWRKVIVNGLETMEVMVLFLTDDFEESIWTMQEVGYALGKGVPIVSLKVGRKDPPGFVSHKQALKGSVEQPFVAARGLFPLIAKALGREERLQEILIASFLESPDFTETKSRFDRMAAVVAKLTVFQVAKIIAGFYANDQLYNAGHLTSRYERLRKFLERATGNEFEIKGRTIRQLKKPAHAFDDLDSIPF